MDEIVKKQVGVIAEYLAKLYYRPIESLMVRQLVSRDFGKEDWRWQLTPNNNGLFTIQTPGMAALVIYGINSPKDLTEVTIIQDGRYIAKFTSNGMLWNPVSFLPDENFGIKITKTGEFSILGFIIEPDGATISKQRIFAEIKKCSKCGQLIGGCR